MSRPKLLQYTHALFFILFFLNFSLGTSRTDRILTATDGAIAAKKLDENFSAVVNSISYNIYDAFEGSKVNSPVEAEMFMIGNKLHIKSSEHTIYNRLTFDVNDKINREILLESEKLLRSEPFLADAIIEVVFLDKGKVDVIVNSFDQFSTAPGAGFQKPAEQWEYWFGIVESNLLGTGQKMGGFYSSTIDRTTFSGLYENNAFLFKNFTLKGGAGKSSDGYNYNYFIGRPLVSKKQKYSYSISGTGLKSIKRYYLDSDLKRLYDWEKFSEQHLAQLVAAKNPVTEIDELKIESEIKADFDNALSEAKSLFVYNDIVNLDFNAVITKSMGDRHKFNLSGVYRRIERYHDGNRERYISRHIYHTGTAYEDFNPYGAYALDFRMDNLLGLTLSYYQRDYKTVKNFRNMKWSEDLDVGFRITNGLFQNISALGANNSDLYLTHTLVYINAWKNTHFITSSLNSSYFLDLKGEFEDGIVKHFLEYQFKPISQTSTYLSSSWANYFAKEKSAQLLLGGEQGLSSYPNRYFAGQARLFIQAEQRYFPDIEFATAVPAFAVFLNAGNAWQSYQDFEWDELHYSTGFGIRLGQTRSVQKVVNHINISFPLDSKYRKILPNWRFTVLAKASL